MVKKYRLIVGLFVIGFITSGFGQSVGASANAGDTEQKEKNYRIVFQGNIDREHYGEIEKYLAKCLSKWNVTWDNNGKKKDNNSKKENVTKQPKQPQEQPKQEQPKIEEPKQEQPSEHVIKKPTQPSQPAQNEQVEQGKGENQQADLGQLNQFEQQVFDLTNKERVKYGLKPLEIDYELSRVAREKSRDMAVNRYFDHNSPTYGSPFDMMRAYGISYRSAGENIAKGQRTPEEVVNAWMNSEGHRANILNSSFTHIGVGYVEQGNHWTQQFIGK